jgi:hypothetical protein
MKDHISELDKMHEVLFRLHHPIVSNLKETVGPTISPKPNDQTNSPPVGPAGFCLCDASMFSALSKAYLERSLWCDSFTVWGAHDDLTGNLLRSDVGVDTIAYRNGLGVLQSPAAK